MSLLNLETRSAGEHDKGTVLAPAPCQSHVWRWDEADTPIGQWAKLCHDHSNLVVSVWVVATLCMLSVVFMGHPDDRCSPGKSGQMQVCLPSQHSMEVANGVHSQRKDALKDAIAQSKESFHDVVGRDRGKVVERSKPVDNLPIVFAYEYPADSEARDGDIFTPHTVKAMCEQEAAFTAHPLWPHFCIWDAETMACADQPTSIVRFFYRKAERNPASGGCRLLSEAAVRAGSHLVMSNVRSINGFFVSREAEPGRHTSKTRSMLRLGGPLAGFDDLDDDTNAQKEIYDRFLRGWTCDGARETGRYAGFDPCAGNNSAAARGGFGTSPEETLLYRFGMRGFPEGGAWDGALWSGYFAQPLESLPDGGGLLSYFWTLAYQKAELQSALRGDVNFAALSVLVVFLYIRMHVASTFLAVCAMLQILLSIPIGFFLYYNVLGVHAYTQMHIVVVYVALGIGADDIFVLSDAWRQSASRAHLASSLGRLHYTLDRGVKTCFITTFTTVLSFAATSLTPLTDMHTFAVFASMVLLVNYVLAVALFPALLMIHHRLCESPGCCGGGAAASRRQGEERGSSSSSSRVLRMEMGPRPTAVVVLVQKNGAGEPAASDAKERSGAEITVGGGRERAGEVEGLELWLRDSFAARICGKRPGGEKPLAWMVVVGFSVAAAVMTWQALQLSTPTSRPNLFPSGHMMSQHMVSLMTTGWWGGPQSQFLDIAFVFGVAGIDRTGFNPLFPDFDRGTAQFDADFDVTTAAGQALFMSACDGVREAKCTVAGACVYEELVKPSEAVVCAVEDMLEYYRNNWPAADPAASHVPPAEFLRVWEKFLTDPAAVKPAGSELGFLGHVLGEQIQHQFGIDPQVSHQNKYQHLLGVIDGRVAFATIRFISSFPSPATNTQTHQFFDDLEGMVVGWKARAPREMGSIFVTDEHYALSGFTWMAVEDALVRNLLQGFAICFPVALLVLVFTTGNLVVAAFATVSIAFIVAGVLGGVRLFLGWHLGLEESVAGVLVIGFAVDYTVHLGHMYNAATHLETREEKTTYALTHVGPTIIGGGLTTALSSLVLFACTITIFTKMATLLVLTVSLSVLHAMLFFISLCAVAGPTHGFGDVSRLSWLLRRRGSTGYALVALPGTPRSSGTPGATAQAALDTVPLKPPESGDSCA